MYQFDLWYMSFCVGDRVVCRFGWNIQTFKPHGHLHRVHIPEVVLIKRTLLMISTKLLNTWRELEKTSISLWVYKQVLDL